MTRSYVTDTINLTSYDFSENDKIVVMYSREKGLIKGIAKGCKKPKSKLGATMQSLVANKIILNKGRNLDIISQAEAENSFSDLKKDFNKLSFSMYCAEIISNFGAEEDLNSENIYNLFYTALQTVSSAKNNIEMMLAVLRFQLKIMNLTGFQVSLNNCSNCARPFSKEENFKFSVTTGGILCKNCFDKLQNLSGKVVSIHPKIVNFLSALETSEFQEKTIYDELATEKICIICFNLLKDYISYHSSKKFKTIEILELA